MSHSGVERHGRLGGQTLKAQRAASPKLVLDLSGAKLIFMSA